MLVLGMSEGFMSIIRANKMTMQELLNKLAAPESSNAAILQRMQKSAHHVDKIIQVAADRDGPENTNEFNLAHEQFSGWVIEFLGMEAYGMLNLITMLGILEGRLEMGMLSWRQRCYLYGVLRILTAMGMVQVIEGDVDELSPPTG